VKSINYLSLFLLVIPIGVRAQQNNTQDSIFITPVKILASQNKLEDAATLLFRKIEQVESEQEDKNKSANFYLKHQDYYFSLCKKRANRTNFLKRVINLREQAKVTDSMGLVLSYYYYASDLNNANAQYVETLAYVNKAEETWQKFYTTPTNLQAEILTLKAATLSNLGLEGESFELFEQALKVYDAIEDVDPVMINGLYMALAKNYIRYGFYKKATYYVDKVYTQLKSAPDFWLEKEKITHTEYIYITEVFAVYARLYKDTQNEEKLTALIKEAETFIKDKQLSKRAQYSIASTYNYAGLYYQNSKKDYIKAQFYYELAKKTMPANFLTVYKDYYSMNIAKAKADQGENEQALTMLNYIIKERPMPKQLKGFMYAARAQIYAEKKQTKKAIEDASTSLAYFSKSETPLDILQDTIVSTYQVSKQLNDTRQLMSIANRFYKNPTNDSLIKASNHLYKIALAQFKNAYTKNFYSKKLEELFQEIVYGVLKTNQLRYGVYNPDDTILKTVIDYKSKFLWHKFLTNRNDELLKTPDSLATKEKRLRKKLTLVYEEMNQAEVTAESESMVTEIKQELEILSDRIQANYSSYAYFDDDLFDLDQFRSRLTSDEIVLKYQNFEGQLFLFVIHKEGTKTVHLNDFKTIEDRAILFTKVAHQPQNAIEDIHTNGQELYTLLGLDVIKDYHKITIIPDGVLHYVPFDLLSYNEQFLIENKNIRYSTSLPLVAFQAKPTSRNANKPIFFSPSYTHFKPDAQTIAMRGATYNLEGALAEANQIRKMIGGVLYTGKEATKDNFIKYATESSILHLSMHALLNNENPELGSLVFSDHVEENQLYISELYGLNFKADLAVLSACNTGIGNYKSGEGMISLNRAFTYAGVPTTVASMWSAPDIATKQIMVDFYNNLEEGISSSQALREAKLTYLKNTTDSHFKHPFYWAGFVHHGKDIPLQIKTSNTRMYYGIVSLILIAMAIFYRKKKRAIV